MNRRGFLSLLVMPVLVAGFAPAVWWHHWRHRWRRRGSVGVNATSVGKDKTICAWQVQTQGLTSNEVRALRGRLPYKAYQ